MRARLLRWLQQHFPDAPPWLIPDQTSLVGLGFLLAAIAAVWLARRDRLDLQRLAAALSLSFVGALLGARLLAALANPTRGLANPSVLLSGRGIGAISFGALLGGCAAFWAYARHHKMPLWRYADAISPSAGLGLCFARLGCFAQGCDYGRISDWAWAVRYPSHSPGFRAQLEHGFVGPYQHLSLPTHPFQLLLASWSLIVFLVFTFWRPTLPRRGDLAIITALAYFLGRLVIEFSRSPYTSPMLGFLNTSQWLCVAASTLLYGLWRLDRPATTHASPILSPSSPE